MDSHSHEIDMDETRSGDNDIPEQAIELLQQEDGVSIPELAEALNCSRQEARSIVNRAERDYELGSSADFRYKIIGRE